MRRTAKTGTLGLRDSRTKTDQIGPHDIFHHQNVHRLLPQETECRRKMLETASVKSWRQAAALFNSFLQAKRSMRFKGFQVLRSHCDGATCRGHLLPHEAEQDCLT
jgi:hypothetical protein